MVYFKENILKSLKTQRLLKKIQKKTVKPNRVLITGAGGFIGGNLAAFLSNRGYDVTKFDISLGNSGYPELINQD
ncbi:MAG TPA: hypothetical protein DEG69_20025 [Flavobacteriaceae bacterium]|nr:hypothetical protein [Flavobacteriaceae bacterium]